jgi:hypothetical protein
MEKKYILAIFSGVIGFLTGILVNSYAIGEGYEKIILLAPLASVLTALGLDKFWKPNTNLKKVLFAVSLVCISHFLTFYFFVLYQNVCNFFSQSCKSSLGESSVNPIQGIWVALMLSFISLFIYGLPHSLFSILAVFRIYKKD